MVSTTAITIPTRNEFTLFVNSPVDNQTTSSTTANGNPLQMATAKSSINNLSPFPIETNNHGSSNTNQRSSFFSQLSPATSNFLVESPSRIFEKEFCKQFECCGFILCDLHELLSHFEKYHSNQKSKQQTSMSSSPSTYTSAFRGPISDKQISVPMGEICKRAVVDMTDPDLTDIEDSDDGYDDDDGDDESSTAKPETTGTVLGTTIVAPPSSYSDPIPTELADGTLRPSNKRRSTKSNSTGGRRSNPRKKKSVSAASVANNEEESNTDTDIDIITVDDDDLTKKVKKMTLQLPISPPTTDDDNNNNSNNSSVEVGNKKNTISMQQEQVITPPKAQPQEKEKKKRPKQSSLSMIDPETGERKYMCAVPSCKKVYKNANGLKYHLAHAHSDGEGLPKEYALFQKKKDEDGIRPYSCTVENCNKKYKNLNGLKYHIEHCHVSLLPPVNSTHAATQPVAYSLLGFNPSLMYNTAPTPTTAGNNSSVPQQVPHSQMGANPGQHQLGKQQQLSVELSYNSVFQQAGNVKN